MNIREYIRKKALGMTGLIGTEVDPRNKSERLTFVNDLDDVRKNHLREYNIWYVGDGQELLNFYTRAETIDWNTDPLYNRNKKCYFWSVAATESDIKRTHSGQPRNIVDTLVSILGNPRIGIGSPDGPLAPADRRLQKILRDNNFNHMLMQKARPMTLVEGWGAWKVNWDVSYRDTPILLYYRADSVDFVYRYGNCLAGIIYRDYYQDEKGKSYILFETRRQDKRDGKPCLIIEKELFRINNESDEVTPVKLENLPQLRDVKPRIIIDNYSGFMGQPCIYYEDSTGDCYGRSIFTGKIDLFDDLDQCLSQSANAVRRSTVHEYFNTLYLEKDERTGLPKAPRDFDRKYVLFRGAKNGDGSMNGSTPVQVTQPAIDFAQYSLEEQNILLQAISGVMSPATLGIDVAKKDNGVAEREKEKVTIFTRNAIIEEETYEIASIANELMNADQFMHSTDGAIESTDYDVYVKYDEFADASFESKLETVMAGWQGGLLSDEMAVDYLYRADSKEIRDRELRYIKETKKLEQSLPQDPGELGAELGGLNNNPYDQGLKKGGQTTDLGLADYASVHDPEQ